MSAGHFPASAANSLVEGYCTDFVSLAAAFAQTLEQISMRAIDISDSKDRLERTAAGMQHLAAALRELLGDSATGATAVQVGADQATRRAGAERPEAGAHVTNAVAGRSTAGKSAASRPGAVGGGDARPISFEDQRPTGSEWDPTLDSIESNPTDRSLFEPEAASPAGATTNSPDPWDDDITSGDARDSAINGRGADADDQAFADAAFAEPSFAAPPEPSKFADAEDEAAIARFVSNRTDPILKVDKPVEPPPRTHDFGALEFADGDAELADRPAGKTAGKTPRHRARQLKEPKEEDIAAGLKGTSASMPVLSVFQFLGRTRKSGVMTVQVDFEILTFEFENGCIQACSSSNPGRGERLGDLLVETGVCSQRSLSRLLHQHENSTGESLGDLIVREGVLSVGQLLEALELQVRRRFTRVCEAREASYAFAEKLPRRTDGRIRIAPIELMFDSSWDPE